MNHIPNEDLKHAENPVEVLKTLSETGIINETDLHDIMQTTIKREVLKIHHYSISQGKGKDTRWATSIRDPLKKGGRKRIAKPTEEELYQSLYKFYFEDQRSYEDSSLADIYLEWLQYKSTLTNRSTTIRRIDNDYKKYYLNEPLSQEILNHPLRHLRKIDIEKWAYALIKKYNMPRKNYNNMSIILRQVLDYMVDMEIINDNPFRKIHIRPNTFRRVIKKPAETQIFYEDEIGEIIHMAYEMAEKTGDESYLAIPLIFRTGIRLGECLGLSENDFDRTTNTVSVHRSMIVEQTLNPDGTWEKRRCRVVDYLKQNAEPKEILVGDDCFRILDKVLEMKKKSGSSSELLFPVNSLANIEHKLYHICSLLDIQKRSPHKIRKTYISMLLNKGVDPDFVRSQVGHRELQTTLNCYTYSTTRKQKQIDQLNAILQ